MRREIDLRAQIFVVKGQTGSRNPYLVLRSSNLSRMTSRDSSVPISPLMLRSELQVISWLDCWHETSSSGYSLIYILSELLWWKVSFKYIGAWVYICILYNPYAINTSFIGVFRTFFSHPVVVLYYPRLLKQSSPAQRRAQPASSDNQTRQGRPGQAMQASFTATWERESEQPSKSAQHSKIQCPVQSMSC